MLDPTDRKPHMLDIHVLLSDRVPAVWQTKCLDSVFRAMWHAPFNAQLHPASEIVGDLWAARRSGYAHGTAPYVTYVDPDDWLDDRALIAIHEPMLAGAQAIIAGGYYVDVSNQDSRMPTTGGLNVFRRDVLDRIDWDSKPGHCPRCALSSVAKVTTVPDRIYFRRVGYNSLGQQYDKQRSAS